MTAPIWNVGQHVIQIVVQAVTVPKNSAHQSAECSWGIYKPERHHAEAEKPTMTYEGGEIPIFFIYWDLPVTLPEVKLGKVSVSSKFGKYFLGSRHRLGIKDGDTVEFSVVDTDSGTSVWFLYHHDR